MEHQLEKYGKDDRLKAAYALNMCTVSVSQIVDYNDVYILEQEYDAILNNLNLEQIPKDAALLNILVELLNTVTFFRIQEMKKAQIEKDYQQRMKNAIWSAIPNMSVIVAGGPAAIAVSLATQIGIGYMNYRREKAHAATDKEKSDMEIQITALEQFNALRRELFTTAWKLADEYNFPDRYRLTEKQIHQYNTILMDQDEVRKYARLEAIQDNFEAFPPFWYFLGHSANYISQSEDLGLDANSKEHYRSLAMEHFEEYDRLNKFSILREDQLSASFALEYIDLLMVSGSADDKKKSKINGLLETAVRAAGNANDILELCAIAYLKIGNLQGASKLLKILVNEEYNTTTNAKLLSRLYASEFLQATTKKAGVAIKADYKVLASRVNPTCLFPMPQEKCDDEQLQNQYLIEQKVLLAKEYRVAMSDFIKKYIVLFHKVLPMPCADEEYSDEYFEDTDYAKKQRCQKVQQCLAEAEKGDYIKMLENSAFRTEYLELLNHVVLAMDELTFFKDFVNKDLLVCLIRHKIVVLKPFMKRVQEKMKFGIFSAEDYREMEECLSFQTFTKSFFDELKNLMMSEISNLLTVQELEAAYFNLTQFCHTQNIAAPEMETGTRQLTALPTGNSAYFESSILGESIKDEEAWQERKNKMLELVKKASSDILLDASGKTEFLICGSEGFHTYFRNRKLNRGEFKYETLAIIDDKTKRDCDFVLTYDGFRTISHNRINGVREYKRIQYEKDGANEVLAIGWPDQYTNKCVDISKLYKLVEELNKLIEG